MQGNRDEEIKDLREILKNLKGYSRHLLSKNMEMEVKLTLAIESMQEALRQGDVGDESSFKLSHTLHKIQDFEDGRAVIQDIWIQLAGLTKALMHYADPQNWMQEPLGTPESPDEGPNMIYGFNEHIGGEIARDALEKYGVNYASEIEEPLDEVDSKQCF